MTYYNKNRINCCMTPKGVMKHSKIMVGILLCSVFSSSGILKGIYSQVVRKKCAAVILQLYTNWGISKIMPMSYPDGLVGG